MAASAIQELTSRGVGSFLFNLKELFCACSACSNLYSAKEKLKIVSARGEGRIPFELFLKYTTIF